MLQVSHGFTIFVLLGLLSVGEAIHVYRQRGNASDPITGSILGGRLGWGDIKDLISEHLAPEDLGDASAATGWLPSSVQAQPAPGHVDLDAATKSAREAAESAASHVGTQVGQIKQQVGTHVENAASVFSNHMENAAKQWGINKKDASSEADNSFDGAKAATEGSEAYGDPTSASDAPNSAESAPKNHANPFGNLPNPFGSVKDVFSNHMENAAKQLGINKKDVSTSSSSETDNSFDGAKAASESAEEHDKLTSASDAPNSAPKNQANPFGNLPNPFSNVPDVPGFGKLSEAMKKGAEAFNGALNKPEDKTGTSTEESPAAAKETDPLPPSEDIPSTEQSQQESQEKESQPKKGFPSFPSFEGVVNPHRTKY